MGEISPPIEVAKVRAAESPVFYVKASTVPIALAEAVAKILRNQPSLTLQAIGAGAVYRATQALTIARVLLAADQLDLSFITAFGESLDGAPPLIGMIFEVERLVYTGVSPIRVSTHRIS